MLAYRRIIPYIYHFDPYCRVLIREKTASLRPFARFAE